MIRFATIMFLFLFHSKNAITELKVESTAFAAGHYIPYRFTCDGQNVSPELRIKNIPKDAKSLVVTLMDSTVAFGVFDHWMLWNVLPREIIPENNKTGTTGRNSSKQNKYSGPCPPNSIHEYYFRVYALDKMLNLPDTLSRQNLLKAIQGHVLAKGELFALFQRQ